MVAMINPYTHTLGKFWVYWSFILAGWGPLLALDWMQHHDGNWWHD